MVKKICEQCGKSFYGSPTAKLCASCNDLTGRTFGKWKVLEKSQKRGSHDYYLCECECGKIKEVSGYNLKTGKSTSCGCERTKRLEERKDDLTGRKYAELTVIKYINTSPDKKNRYWSCRCSCGKIVTVSTTDLTTGRIKSCGHLVGEKVSEIADCGTNPASIYSKKLNARNKSGVKGVYYDTNKRKWIAEIMFQRKRYILGSYHDKNDAVSARKEAEDKLFGDFFDWYAKKYPEKWKKLNDSHKT